MLSLCRSLWNGLALFVVTIGGVMAQPALLVHWPLDEAGNGATPDAFGRYPLELVNLSEADLVSGRRGNAIAFDAARETMLARTHAANEDLPLNQHADFTISLWVKGKGTGQSDLRVFSEGSPTSNTPLFNIGTDRSGDSDVVDIFIRPGSDHLLSNGAAFDDTWRHLAWVQEGDEARLYIDGEEDSAGFEPARDLDVAITSIGGIRRMGGDSHWFTGSIDDVALWDGALSAEEVARLAEGESPATVTDAVPGEVDPPGGGGDGGGGGEPFEPSGDQLRITEFLASNNSQRRDANGDYSDWVEIWNPTGSAVDLEGWYLTDEEGESRWAFPSVTLESGAYLVVHASGTDEVIDEEIHTSFRLSRSAGGYLGLLDPDGLTVVDEIRYDERQRSDVSYGRDINDQLGYFKRPTPGSGNGSSIKGFVADTRFSVDRGFYDEAFDLEITTETEGAKILYTLDGSEPEEGSLFTPDHGEVYSGPVRVDKTTTIRAIALKDGFEATNVDTQSYLFIDDIAEQPVQPEGWPEDWGTNGEVPGRVVSDYEMDPRVVENTLPGYSLREALLDIPTLSLVMDRDDFIGRDGIYTNPQSRGDAFEKPCSLELIYPDGEEGFQVNAGVEVHGNSSRRPWRMQKHSLRVSFKTKYGPSRLNYRFFKHLPIEDFNKIVLRACFTDSWGLVSWGPGRYRPNDSQYIRDMWMKWSQRDMGHDTMDGNFMHLYINGLYWGLFNPAEKMEAESMVTHLGGAREDYDIIDDFRLAAH